MLRTVHNIPEKIGSKGISGRTKTRLMETSIKQIPNEIIDQARTNNRCS